MAIRLTKRAEAISEKMVVLTTKVFFWLEVVVKKMMVRAAKMEVWPKRLWVVLGA